MVSQKKTLDLSGGGGVTSDSPRKRCYITRPDDPVLSGFFKACHNMHEKRSFKIMFCDFFLRTVNLRLKEVSQKKEEIKLNPVSSFDFR